MEWEELWQKLQKKSVGKKIVEMNSAYEKLGSNISIEEICHGIFDDYEQIRQELDATKREILDILEKLPGVHLHTSRVKSVEPHRESYKQAI